MKTTIGEASKLAERQFFAHSHAIILRHQWVLTKRCRFNELVVYANQITGSKGSRSGPMDSTCGLSSE